MHLRIFVVCETCLLPVKGPRQQSFGLSLTCVYIYTCWWFCLCFVPSFLFTVLLLIFFLTANFAVSFLSFLSSHFILILTTSLFAVLCSGNETWFRCNSSSPMSLHSPSKPKILQYCLRILSLFVVHLGGIAFVSPFEQCYWNQCQRERETMWISACTTTKTT